MNRYIVIAFYDNLGIKTRITSYSNKNNAYEYIGALRFCDTPYLAFDCKRKNIFDIGLYDGYTKEKMIEVLENE